MVVFKVFVILSTLSRCSAKPLQSKRDLCSHPLNWRNATCQDWLIDHGIIDGEDINKTNEDGSTTDDEKIDYNLSNNMGRIVGGDDVPLGAYPWFAKAARKFLGLAMWEGCGGMLVSPEWVMTAAHCVYEGEFSAYEIGAICHSSIFPYASNGNCGQSSEIISTLKTIMHPNYNDNTFNNDFALVKLKKRSTTTPVKMDLNGIADSYSSSKKLWAIGFGNLSSGPDDKFPGRLQHVELSFVPPLVCDINYGGLITDSMLCAADPGQDSCQGDSGGPLYDAENNVLVGVVSWGNGCALSGFPGVYAQISRQSNWIVSTICSDHSSPLPDFCTTDESDNTDVPPAGSACTDLLWKDAYGDDCSWYSSTYLCQKYGDLWPDDQGLTADNACCLCGGGNDPTRESAAPSTSPTIYSQNNDSCQDLDFVDSWGDDCAWYEETNSCQNYGDQFANNQGLTANIACCACGGGATAEVTAEQDPNFPSNPPSSLNPVPCVDSPLKLIINNNTTKSCRWVSNKPEKRCNKHGAASHCPETCNQCESYQCTDSQVRWYRSDVDKSRRCGWVGRKKVDKRCQIPGVADTCRETCGKCNR